MGKIVLTDKSFREAMRQNRTILLSRMGLSNRILLVSRKFAPEGGIAPFNLAEIYKLTEKEKVSLEEMSFTENYPKYRQRLITYLL